MSINKRYDFVLLSTLLTATPTATLMPVIFRE